MALSRRHGAALREPGLLAAAVINDLASEHRRLAGNVLTNTAKTQKTHLATANGMSQRRVATRLPLTYR